MSLAVVLTALAGAPLTGASQLDLGARIEAALEDGLSAEELAALGDEGLRLAAEADSRSGFWSAMQMVAELCAAGPHVEARALRARALGALALQDSDTRRWSSLLTRSFVPAFARIPRSAWAQELAAYETALDALLAAAETDRVRAELLYARAFGRAFIERREEWLSEPQRLEALATLEELESRFGALPVPGSGDPEHETVALRARELRYELERLHFGAPAPSTSGVDLEDRPLDLADERGKIVVLDFWTSFCQPCLALVPGVRALLDELADERVVYLGVCGDVDRRAGLATAQRVGMTWRNLWDGPHGPQGPAARAWAVGAQGWPSVFVIDPRGRIRYKFCGQERIEAELGPALRTLLAESAPDGATVREDR